jgi:hypothetical protein
MATDDLEKRAERKLVETAAGALEVFVGGPIAPSIPIVCAAHPAGVFGESAVDLLREVAETTVVCVNPRGIGGSSAAPSGDTGYRRFRWRGTAGRRCL